MKRFLTIVTALAMLLCVPLCARAEGEKTLSCGALSVPVPADWGTYEMREAGMPVVAAISGEQPAQRLVAMLELDFGDAASASMMMMVYRMFIGHEEMFKQMMIGMLTEYLPQIPDLPEGAENALEIFRTLDMKVSDAELAGRDAVRIEYGVDVSGTRGSGIMAIAAEGTCAYIVLGAFTGEPDNAFFDGVLSGAAFEAAKAAA